MRNEYSCNLDLNYLSHHGIKGQKWGVKMGPPYPLGQGDHSKAEIAGMKKGKKYSPKGATLGGNSYAPVQTNKSSVKDIVNTLSKNFKTETEAHRSYKDYNSKSERSMKVAMHLVAAALPNVSNVVLLANGFWNPVGVLIGGVALTTNLSALIKDETQNSKAMKKKKQLDTEREEEPVDEKSGLHKSSKERTPDECADRINPEYASYMTGTKNNCVACSLSYEMQRRGYDARARKTGTGVDLRVAVDTCFKGTTVTDFGYKNSDIGRNSKTGLPAVTKTQSANLSDSAQKEINSQGVGARGVISVIWNGSNTGHAVAYENTSEGTVIYDCQSGEKFTSLDEVGEFRNIKVIRTDKAKVNYDKLKGFME
jgi:hypothetical protein